MYVIYALAICENSLLSVYYLVDCSVIQYVDKRQEDNVAVLVLVHSLLPYQSRCFPITMLLLRPK